jgi:hypothetical protein
MHSVIMMNDVQLLSIELVIFQATAGALALLALCLAAWDEWRELRKEAAANKLGQTLFCGYWGRKNLR